MNRYFPAIILICLAVISGCKHREEFHVRGTIGNTENKIIYLSRIEINTPLLTDSSRISRNGSFSFRVRTGEAGFYQIGFSDKDFVTILAEPGEKISISFSGKNLYNGYEVSGSPGTLKLMTLDSALAVTKTRIDSLRSAYAELADDQISVETENLINEEYVKILKEQRMFNISFILKNLRSLASIKAVYQKSDETTYVLYDSRDLQFMKLVSDTLSRYYPGSKEVKALRANFEKEYNQFRINRIGELSKNIEPTELNPTLRDVTGKTVSLSSLRGKYVLLTFWSVSSADCIKENLLLKELYSKYNSRGFEIYQINLDTDEEAWKRAVRFDELPWISVREDDPLNPKNAIFYNVRILPANYLYNREGNIEASHLHGRQLELKLAQVFGSK